MQIIYISNPQGHNEMRQDEMRWDEMHNGDSFLWKSTFCIFKYHHAFLSLSSYSFTLVYPHFDNISSSNFPSQVLFLSDGSPFIHPGKHEDMSSASITNRLSYRIWAESGLQCSVLRKHLFLIHFSQVNSFFSSISCQIASFVSEECASKAVVAILSIQF